MKTVQYRERRTLAATSQAVDIPKTTLWERKKEGAVRVHSSTTKPVLTDANKAHRVDFCMAHTGLLNHRYTFHDMLDTVHIDEKCLSLSPRKCTRRSSCMEKVLPAIEEKWPQCHRDMTIKLQQDNAKPHRIHNDPELLEHRSTMTVKVELFDQPPNSPDLNVLDLGYFSAIQALQQQQQQQQRTVDDLIAMASVTLAKIFVTLQKVMELVILNGGSNNFKLPHLGKDRLLNRGMVLARPSSSM
jgi:hypothetical protein